MRQILVKEGQRVRPGQPLILFDDVQPRASYDVFQSQYDGLLAQAARFSAEGTGKTSLEFPPELMARMADPRVAGMIRDQQFLFTTRLQLFQSQNSVLSQRLDQLQTQIEGQQAQVVSVEEQRRLTAEEMGGLSDPLRQGLRAQAADPALSAVHRRSRRPQGVAAGRNRTPAPADRRDADADGRHPATSARARLPRGCATPSPGWPTSRPG